MIEYVGVRPTPESHLSVFVEERTIDDKGEEQLRSEPLSHVCRHSPDGFECGYDGSGPADLALSIVAHATCCPTTATEYIDPGLYQEFKRLMIAPLPRDSGWRLSMERVTSCIAAIAEGSK